MRRRLTLSSRLAEANNPLSGPSRIAQRAESDSGRREHQVKRPPTRGLRAVSGFRQLTGVAEEFEVISVWLRERRADPNPRLENVNRVIFSVGVNHSRSRRKLLIIRVDRDCHRYCDRRRPGQAVLPHHRCGFRHYRTQADRSQFKP